MVVYGHTNYWLNLTQFNNKTIQFCQDLGDSIWIGVFLTNLASLLVSNYILNPVNTQLQILFFVVWPDNFLTLQISVEALGKMMSSLRGVH